MRDYQTVYQDFLLEKLEREILHGSLIDGLNGCIECCDPAIRITARCNRMFQADVRALPSPSAPSVRFLWSRSRGSSAFTAGQLRCQVRPERG